MNSTKFSTLARLILGYSLLFSFVSNVLMLALPIYSMQVLDRVISSGSSDTLLMLTLIVTAALIALCLIHTVRTSLLTRIWDWSEERLSPLLFEYSIASSTHSKSGNGTQALRDLGVIKTFITGSLVNFIDAPWSILFIVVLYMLHPLYGIIAIQGCIIMLILAVINTQFTQSIFNASYEYNIRTMQYSETASRNADVIEAMGMLNNVVVQWKKINDRSRLLQAFGENRLNIINSITKFVRFGLQVLIIAVGAYLVLKKEITVGATISGSLLIGRALAPFDNAISSWKHFVLAKAAYKKLSQILEHPTTRPQSIALPPPQGKIEVEQATFIYKGAPAPTLQNITFTANPGEIICIIGPSASGKSTLSKLIMGIWQPVRGHVRLDGAEVFTWSRQDFGKYVGYLPQGIELFSGNVKSNIARMEAEPDEEKVIKAAVLTGVHDLILHLPNGYETEIGNEGSILSAGQRQRVAIARAFYGDPKLVVLDEPNSNLDHEGNVAFNETLLRAKMAGITVIIIAHNYSVMPHVDKILVLNQGIQLTFGKRDEVLATLAKNAAPPETTKG